MDERMKHVYSAAARARSARGCDHEFVSYLVDQCRERADRSGYVPDCDEYRALLGLARQADDTEVRS